MSMGTQWPMRPLRRFFSLFRPNRSAKMLLRSLAGKSRETPFRSKRNTVALREIVIACLTKSILSRGAWRTNRRTGKPAICHATQCLAD